MNQTTAFLKRHALVIGILLMFALTWHIDLANSGVLPIKFPFLVYFFLGWGYGIASFIMTGLTLGKDAVITLLKVFLIGRVSWKWYLAPFILAPALIVGSVYLNGALTGVPPDFSTAMAHKIFGESASLPLFILPFFTVDFITNAMRLAGVRKIFHPIHNFQSHLATIWMKQCTVIASVRSSLTMMGVKPSQH